MIIARIKNFSIRVKIILVAIAVSMISLTLTVISLLVLDYIAFRKIKFETVSNKAKVTGETNRLALDVNAINTIKIDLYDTYLENPNIKYVCIFNKEKKIVADYDRSILVENNLLDSVLIISRMIADSSSVLYQHDQFPPYKTDYSSFDFVNNKYELYMPIKENQSIVGSVYIRSSLDEFFERYKQYAYTILAVFIITIFSAFIFSYLLQRLISSPITKLSDITQEISKNQNFSIRIKKRQNDEIGILIDGFNEMLGRIELQNESLISAKEEAEELANAKQQFLANMSHEIRTPMNAIMGLTDLLSETNLSEEQRKNLEIIKKSADNLLVIVNDILDFSKIEAGSIVFEEKIVDLEEIIQTIVLGGRTIAQRKGLEIITKISDQTPKKIYGDPVRLTQILLNLFSNALKFTDKGSIKILVDKIGERDGKDLIQISVIDTGVGIPEDKFESIFDIFTQASSETTRKYGGTGLGLSICKQLVELQGGKIWVDSIINCGSTFTLQIPFKKVDKADLKENPVLQENIFSDSEFTDLKILLAEDNEVNQMLVVNLLTKWGWSVDVASDGNEALGKLNHKAYDVILMDVHMPELDGYEATKAIRKLEKPKSEIPIMAMTASALSDEAARCLEVGMDDYISKPFNKNELRYKILKLVYQDDQSNV